MPDNITFEQPMTFNKEIILPSFDTLDDLNAYTPNRAGALSRVGAGVYKYDGTDWVELNDANASGATLRGDIPETT